MTAIENDCIKIYLRTDLGITLIPQLIKFLRSSFNESPPFQGGVPAEEEVVKPLLNNFFKTEIQSAH
jgi:hypothetical protein